MGGGLHSFAYAYSLHATVLWFYVRHFPPLQLTDVCVSFCKLCYGTAARNVENRPFVNVS